MRLDSIERIARALNDGEVRFIVVGGLELIPFSEDPLGNLGMFLIPSLILGTASAAAIMRLTRTMMLEVLRQD